MRELLLELRALGDVACVQDDAVDVLVLEQVRVLDLELQDGAVAMAQRGLEDLGLPGLARRPVAQDLDEPRAVAGREQRLEAGAGELVGVEAEDGERRRALVDDPAVGAEHRDEVGRVAHERAEAGLAAPGVDLLGQLRAAEGQGDLRGQVAQGGAIGEAERLAGGDEQDAAQLLARGEADREDVRAAAREPEVGAQRRAQREQRHLGIGGQGEQRLGRRSAQVTPGEELCRGAVGRDDPQLAVLEERERARRSGAQLAGRPHGGRVELVALGRADERGAGAAQHALARGGALLLADEAGHAGHDEDEEDDRREDDDEEVDVAAADLADDLDGGRDERRERQERQADRRQARRVPGGGLGELAHRRVQRGGAPEEVEADPADVEDDLAVVGAVQRHDAVDEVGDEQRDDAR